MPDITPTTGWIPRTQLPQIRRDDHPNFLQFLWGKGVEHTTTELPASELKPTQHSLNTDKILALLDDPSDALDKPVLVSQDRYILDGHHSHAALHAIAPDALVPVHILHTPIDDLIKLAFEFPNTTTKSLTESTESTAVMAFGRMNPPTAGHAKLVDAVHKAGPKDAHREVVVSHSQDEKKNPLSIKDKLKHTKRFFPNTHVVAASKEEPTIMHHAARLHAAGHKHLVVVAGQDRVKEYHKLLHDYNGKKDKDGHGYHFKSIKVVSAGKRDPDAEGVEGMSASKMRSHAAAGKFSEFKKGVPGHVSTAHAKELYHDTRKGMHVESVEYITEGVHDQGIFKAVFLAGGPGSGKDFVMRKSLDGHGMVEINSDNALEYLMDKQKLDKKMPDSEKDQRDAVRAKAKSIAELRHRLALHGRNGMIINSTGDDKTKIGRLKKMLEDEGYDTKMVFVHASDKVSAERNIARGQRGGRMVPEKVRAAKWQKSQDQRVDYAKLFGTDNYHEYDNSADHKTAPPEEVQQKEQELTDLFKTVKKFTQTPPAHPKAQQWIAKSLGNLINQPKMAEKLTKEAPPKFPGRKLQPVKSEPNANSEAAEEARRKGLQYYGYGKYGKGGTVTHFSLHGKLQQREAPPTPEEKKRAAEKAKASTAPQKKAINEEFEALLTEGPTDAPVSVMQKAQELGRTGVQIHLNTLYQKRDALPKEKHGEWNKEIRKYEAAKLHTAPPAMPQAPAPAKKPLGEMLNALRGIPERYMEELDEAPTTGPRLHYMNKKACAGCGKKSSFQVNNSINKFCRSCQQVDPETLKAKSTTLYKEANVADAEAGQGTALSKTAPLSEKLSPAKQAEVDAESAKIKASAETPEAKARHAFKSAHWTHPNGHPRCRICGDEEPVGGYCNS